MCVGEERCIQDFGGGHLRERDNLGDLGIVGWIIQGAAEKPDTFQNEISQ